MIPYIDKINMTQMTHNNTQWQTYWPRRTSGRLYPSQDCRVHLD